MENNSIGLLSPWEIYYKKICSMFDKDPEIELTSKENNDEFHINITVKTLEKQEALKELLNNELQMGSIKVIVTVSLKKKDRETLYKDAFKNNPLFISYEIGRFNHYCIFKAKIIQFYTNDLSDYYSNYNGLLTNIARDIIKPQYYVAFSIEQINNI